MATPPATTMDSIISCLCSLDPATPRSGPRPTGQPLLDTKPAPTPQPTYLQTNANIKSSSTPTVRSPETIAADIVSLIRTAEKRGVVLTKQLDNAVSTTGWTEWIAEKVLCSIEAVLREGKEKMGPAMTEAYDKACEAADKVFHFAKDHPLATARLLTIIAVGVLVLFAPEIVEVLGFAELGPVEGSFAAWWESTYAGFIPKGSLFSFFQRLGMVWGKAGTREPPQSVRSFGLHVFQWISPFLSPKSWFWEWPKRQRLDGKQDGTEMKEMPRGESEIRAS